MPPYKDKKTGKWITSFYYKLADGTRKHKTKRGFRTKKEAQQWEDEFKSKNEGSITMLFKDFVDLYVTDKVKRKEWKPTSKKSNLSKINNWIMPEFENIPLNEIDKEKVRVWQNKLLDTSLADMTLLKIRKTLSAIFNYAVRYYDLKENPLHKVESIGSSKGRDPVIWSKEEFDTFLSHVEDDSYKIAFETFFYTGLRLGELTGLTLKDFDFSIPQLTVNNNFQIIDGEEWFLEPKTPKSKRIVSLSPTLANHIQDYIKKMYALGEDDRVFNLHPSSYGNKLRKICNEHNLKKIRLHDLRHSHISMLISMGYDPVLVAERVGHDDVSTTLNIYSHTLPDKQKELAQNIDSLIS